MRWNELYTANPTTTFQSNDIFCLARSPYASGDSYGFTYSSLIPVTTKGDLFTWGTSATKLSVGSNGTILQASSVTPTGLSYTTATYPSSINAGEIMYSSSTNVIQGLASANKAVLTSGATGIPAMTGPLADGEFIIGSTSGVPAVGTITSLDNTVTVTKGANTIDLSVVSSPGLLPYVDLTAGVIVSNLTVNTAYGINSGATPRTLPLPVTSAAGDVIDIIGYSAGGWTVTCGVGQSIIYNGTTTTASAGGAIPSSCMKITCLVANTVWVANTAVGGLNLA